MFESPTRPDMAVVKSFIDPVVVTLHPHLNWIASGYFVTWILQKPYLYSLPQSYNEATGIW